jgi:hypothetical protein
MAATTLKQQTSWTLGLIQTWTTELSQHNTTPELPLEPQDMVPATLAAPMQALTTQT